MFVCVFILACRGNAPVEEMGPALPPGSRGGSPSASPSAPVAAGTQALPSEPDAVICTMDGRPVTAGELDRFREEQLGGGRHRGMGRLEPQQVVDSYRRYFAVKKLAETWKIRESGEFAEELAFRRAALLAGPYGDHLKRTAVIPPEEISGVIPRDWVEMDFQILGFPSREEAEKAYRAILDDKGRIPDGDLPGEVKVAGKMRPRTGMLLKGTPYFDIFDQPHLFALREGEVSHPVKTDLGPVLAKVVARHDYTPEEQAELLARKRGELAKEHAFRKAMEIAEGYPVKIDAAAMEQAVQDYLLDPAHPSAKVVGWMGDRPISYRRFVREGKPGIPFMVQSVPRDRWMASLERDFRDFAGGMALGFTAVKTGFKQDGLDKTMESFSRQAEYDMVLDRLWEQTKATVGEEEIRSRYDKGKDAFMRPETASVQYYFSPFREEIELLAERAKKGDRPFGGLGRDLERASNMKSGVKPPPAMKERTIVRGALELQDVQDALFGMKKDEVRIVEGKMGVYLVRMVDKSEREQLPFSQVRDRIGKEIGIYRRKSQVDAYLQKLTQDVVVEMLESPASPGMPVPGFPDRG